MTDAEYEAIEAGPRLYAINPWPLAVILIQLLWGTIELVAQIAVRL